MVGGAGRDAYIIDFFGGVERDTILSFDPTEDVIVTTLWEDSQGDPIRDLKIVEDLAAGTTKLITSEFDGTVVHTLTVDAVGIMGSLRDGYSWDGFA